MKNIASLSFYSSLVLESSASPKVQDLGEHKNEMTLYEYPLGGLGIEWTYWPKGTGNSETEHIGIILEGNKVVDYDGVFSLPKQAQLLLEAAGYDTSEVGEWAVVSTESFRQVQGYTAEAPALPFAAKEVGGWPPIRPSTDGCQCEKCQTLGQGTCSVM